MASRPNSKRLTSTKRLNNNGNKWCRAGLPRSTRRLLGLKLSCAILSQNLLQYLKADSKSKLQLYNQAKALDGEIHLLNERDHILENEVENGVRGLTEVEFSLAKCRCLLASVEKKTAHAAIALVVTDIISASISLEQTTIAPLGPKSSTPSSEPILPQQELPEANEGT